MSRRKRWSWSIGEYGQTVRVFARGNGRLYGVVGRGNNYVALKHDDQERAKAWAKEEYAKLVKGERTANDPTPTVAKVFAAYQVALKDVDVIPTTAYENRRRIELFTRVLGADRDLSKLTLGEWQHFIHQRQTGAIDALGASVADEKRRRPLRPRSVEADCEWLLKVCNWALEWDDRHTGRPLLREHPLKRIKFREAVPHEQNPRRPVATQDRYEAIVQKAPKVHPFLAPLLAIVNGTGRRITAILSLTYADLKLGKSPSAPFGAIKWPGETDKQGKEWAAPINQDTRAALDRFLKTRPGIGGGYLFPAPENARKPMDRWFASKLLRKAERLAKVPKLRGSLWHCYRRKWVTERKHLPIQDVAQAGGWKSVAVPQTIYAQPDEATLYRVVSEPAELREAKGA